jgi:hypothetical protein
VKHRRCATDVLPAIIGVAVLLLADPRSLT